MATSPNYGWSEPDNTSLVKDGAQAMRTLGDAIDTSLWNSGYGQAGKNKVLNGAMQIWQRGTSIGFGYTYTADRWKCFQGDTAATASRSTDVPTGFQYSMKVQRNSGSTSTAKVNLTQSFESAICYPLQGQTATFSFYAKKGANYSSASNALSIGFKSSTGTDQDILAVWAGSVIVASGTVTLTTSWQRFTFTGSVPSNSTQLGLEFAFNPVGTAGADDSFLITGVQVEAGSKATPFQTASGGSIQGELAMCQRYFEKSYDQAVAVGAAAFEGAVLFDNAGGGTRHNIKFSVVKRGTPTVTYYNPQTGTAGQVRNVSTGANVTAAGAIYIGQGSFNTDGGIIGILDLGAYQWTSSAEL
jgi:hypothetical protein